MVPAIGPLANGADLLPGVIAKVFQCPLLAQSGHKAADSTPPPTAASETRETVSPCRGYMVPGTQLPSLARCSGGHAARSMIVAAGRDDNFRWTLVRLFMRFCAPK